MSRDYHYTVNTQGSQTIQRQMFANAGVVIITENRPARVADVCAMTEWGNYCVHFDDCTDICKLLKSSDEYLMDKFLSGHDEGDVLNMEATISAISEQLRTIIVNDDYDWPNHDPETRAMRVKQLRECEDEHELRVWADMWEVNLDVMPLVRGYGKNANAFLRHGLPLVRQSGEELHRMRIGCVDD